MKTIAHISDLHFGKEDSDIADALVTEINTRKPSLVVISGDLTQRAHPKQFRRARLFVAKIESPVLIVPGNHDIPMLNLVRRFITPLRAYKKHITKNLFPIFSDDEMVVAGLNTARSRTLKEGRVSPAQLRRIQEAFGSLPNDGRARVLVAHHPVIIPMQLKRKKSSIRKPKKVVRHLEACGIDLVLSGHLHLGIHGDVRSHLPTATRSMIVAQAGPAIARWYLKEGNAYNTVSIDAETITITVRKWENGSFVDVERVVYPRERMITTA